MKSGGKNKLHIPIPNRPSLHKVHLFANIQHYMAVHLKHRIKFQNWVKFKVYKGWVCNLTKSQLPSSNG